MRNMLKSQNKVANAKKTTSGAFKLFNADRKRLLREVYLARSNFQTSSPGQGLRTDFSKCDQAGKHDGILTETGLVGMTEAIKQNSIDTVMSFITGMVDLCCGMTEASVTSAFCILLMCFKLYFNTMSCTGGACGSSRTLVIRLKTLKRSLLTRFRHTYQQTCEGANGMNLSIYLTTWVTWETFVLFMQGYVNQLTESSRPCTGNAQKDWFQKWKEKCVNRIRPQDFNQS